METNSVSKLLLDSLRQEVVLHHHRLRLRPLAAGGLRGEPEGRRRHRARRRFHAARHHRLLGQSDQGAIHQSGRNHPAACGRRHDQLPQAGGAVRAQQEDPHRRRAAGARSQQGPAAGSAVRRLGVRMVLEAARRAACRGVRRRHPQAHRRQRADRAHLVRLCRDPDLQARRRKGEVARCRRRWPRRCRAWCCRRKSR